MYHVLNNLSLFHFMYYFGRVKMKKKTNFNLEKFISDPSAITFKVSLPYVVSIEIWSKCDLNMTLS